MAERTAEFLSIVARVTTVEEVGEAVVWSRWRRSGTMQFPGAAVKAGQMVWFSDAVVAWRRSGWL
jgi:hypothetical protein